VVLAPRYRNIIFAFHMSAADERGWGSFMPELGVVAQLWRRTIHIVNPCG
jgi:hypothetical protein